MNKAGSGQGLEAWRMLLHRYEAKTRQSKVMSLIQILSWDFKTGDLLDTLESFDNSCQKYYETWKKEIDDDTKIGVVIKGMESGPLREHMTVSILYPSC